MSNHYEEDWGANFLGIPEDIWEDARYMAWVEDQREVEYIDRIADEIEAEQSLDDQD